MRQADLLPELLSGDPSPEAIRALAAGLQRWMSDDSPRPIGLHRHLGLGCPRAARMSLRDSYLIKAAELLEGPALWQRCRQLAEAARAFEARRWPLWHRLKSPPSHATEVDCLLWQARRLGDLPVNPEGFLPILRD